MKLLVVAIGKAEIIPKTKFERGTKTKVITKNKENYQLFFNHVSSK